VGGWVGWRPNHHNDLRITTLIPSPPPTKDPREALALAADPAAARAVDVALVNGRVFMNIATTGPVSEVSSKGMSDGMKRVLGPAAILVSCEYSAWWGVGADAV
jgi:hypothetical protein